MLIAPCSERTTLAVRHMAVLSEFRGQDSANSVIEHQAVLVRPHTAWRRTVNYHGPRFATGRYRLFEQRQGLRQFQAGEKISDTLDKQSV